MKAALRQATPQCLTATPLTELTLWPSLVASACPPSLQYRIRLERQDQSLGQICNEVVFVATCFDDRIWMHLWLIELLRDKRLDQF